MTASVWPPIDPVALRRAEDVSTSRELSWLLESLQETLESVKAGLDECYALLAPIDPGSTLVISSQRSESVKGHITRIGTRIVKGSLQLRLRTHPPAQLAVNSNHPLILQPLVHLRNLLNQGLDCVDITRWTGDRHSASFISGQLRLLHSILSEARQTLKGPPPLEPETGWYTDPVGAESFDPPLLPTLAFSLMVQDAALVLLIRSLEPADAVPDLKSRLFIAIGTQRRLEHDEMEQVFTLGDRDVRVREKVRIESADPSLMSAMAKLLALEHTVAAARESLRILMGEDAE